MQAATLDLSRSEPRSEDESATRNAAYRARYRAERIPSWYRGPWHVAFTALCVLGPAAYCLASLRDVEPLEWLTVPAMLVFGSFFVWAFHKHVLHRPVPGLRSAYVIHTLHHHRFFTFEHNEPEGTRDFHIMLFPMAFGPGLAVVSYLLGRHLVSGISPNVGLLFTTMSVLYFGLYELVHFSSHLPGDATVLRLPFLRRLRAHHQLHHDPRLMGKYNFNVVLPLFDWLLGTRVRERPPP